MIWKCFASSCTSALFGVSCPGCRSWRCNCQGPMLAASKNKVPSSRVNRAHNSPGAVCSCFPASETRPLFDDKEAEPFVPAHPRTPSARIDPFLDGRPHALERGEECWADAEPPRRPSLPLNVYSWDGTLKAHLHKTNWTNIYLQEKASIYPRTSPPKFGNFRRKTELIMFNFSPKKQKNLTNVVTFANWN